MSKQKAVAWHCDECHCPDLACQCPQGGHWHYTVDGRRAYLRPGVNPEELAARELRSELSLRPWRWNARGWVTT